MKGYSIALLALIACITNALAQDDNDVRYILADISCGAPFCIYRNDTVNNNAIEAIKRWDSGIRLVNPYSFERKFLNCSGNSYKTYKYQIWVADDTSKIINIPYVETPNINLYPNPTNSNMTIESSELVKSIQLVSVRGKVSLQQQLNSKTQIVNLNRLEPGFYQAILYLENGAVIYEKVLKR